MESRSFRIEALQWNTSYKLSGQCWGMCLVRLNLILVDLKTAVHAYIVWQYLFVARQNLSRLDA